MSKYIVLLAIIAMLMVGSAMADDPADPKGGNASSASAPAAKQNGAPAKMQCRDVKIQNLRPTNQCGINIFETPKDDTEQVPYEGFKLDWGAAFSQSLQSLKHSNTAAPRIVSGVNANQLAVMGPGFNLAGANLYLNAQLASGVRLQLTTYLSSRHHNEAWVKDGYVQMDELPINLGPFNALWARFVTVKVGHMEVNFGDAHFRRSDNGNGVYNPFVGNYLLDSFTTEIGGEVYLRANGIMAMGSITGGEIKGNVLNPQSRRPAFIGKLGFDRQVKPDLRFRLTGSNYIVRKSPGDTLYGGDRAGPPYYFALENTQATATSQAFSGTINPGFSYKVTAYQVNPFVKYKGLELFGVIEHATGRTAAEIRERTWNQYAGDVVYRFADDKWFAGVRYTWAKGELAGIANKVDVDRTQVAVGYFLNHYLLMKAEFVNQNYNNFPATDIRNGGKFHGFVGQAVLAF